MIYLRFEDLTFEDYLYSTMVPGSFSRAMVSGTTKEKETNAFYMNLNLAAGLGSVLGTAINIGGYRAMGGYTAFVFNLKVKSTPVAMMGLFAHESIAALAYDDVDRHPVARAVNPIVESWFDSYDRNDTRGGRENRLFY